VKIVIQSSALADLADGFDFYEEKEPGLGGYFLDSLYSDIDSLQLYTRASTWFILANITGFCPSGSHMAFIIR